MHNKFIRALKKENDGTPPIWLMRQAGRYHSHYQTLKQNHHFLDLCKNPDLACETAMGPIRDFDFDAAILFSDILFPIEEMGIDLTFAPGPKFSKYLRNKDDLIHYKTNMGRIQNLGYQAEALTKTRNALPEDKGLIGFVGGLLTLYIFAVEGTHKGDLSSAVAGLDDGRFDGFMENMIPMLVENMKIQARANPDCMAILDSGAGTFAQTIFEDRYMPYLKQLIDLFKTDFPDMPVLYYAKNIPISLWNTVANNLNIDAMGVDHSLSMSNMIETFHDRFTLQGNLPPETMSLPTDQARKTIDTFLSEIQTLPKDHLKGWVCGLGHGILPTAKEENVRYFIHALRQRF